MEPDEKIPHEAQVTPAHVFESLQEFRDQLNGRFDRLEGKVDKLERTVFESGLNGHTPYLKSFLEQYAATYQSRQAWITVRGDIAHRLRWLASTRGWLRFLLAAAIGGLATGFASGHLPHF